MITPVALVSETSGATTADTVPKVNVACGAVAPALMEAIFSSTAT
jgi:hypothetical protein